MSGSLSDPKNVAVRLAREEDFTSMAILMGELLEAEGPIKSKLETQVSALRWLSSRPENGRALCAITDNTLIGVCTNHYTISTALSRLVCRVEDVVVSSAYRRRGIGELLVKSSIRQASQDGCARVYLHVGRNNVAAKSLYSKLGFERDEMEIMSYYFDN